MLGSALARRVGSVGLLAFAIVLVAATAIAAGPPNAEEVLVKLGVVDGKLDEVLESQEALADVLTTQGGQLSALVSREDEIDVEVSVWEEACIGVGVQCTSSHSTAPASSANHNPVAIRFFVTRNGQPVGGLNSDSVLLHVNSFPANGPGLERCDNGDGDCSAFGGDFQNAGLGLYVLWVHPFYDPPAAPFWQPGSYAFVLQVTDGDGTTGYGFGEIGISD